MVILRMEHPVRDYDGWKREGFDRDPLDRKGSEVLSHTIMQPADDPGRVMIDLAFAEREQAERMLERLTTMWGNVMDRFGWSELPRAVIVEVKEQVEY